MSAENESASAGPQSDNVLDSPERIVTPGDSDSGHADRTMVDRLNERMVKEGTENAVMPETNTQRMVMDAIVTAVVRGARCLLHGPRPIDRQAIVAIAANVYVSLQNAMNRGGSIEECAGRIPDLVQSALQARSTKQGTPSVVTVVLKPR